MGHICIYDPDILPHSVNQGFLYFNVACSFCQVTRLR